MGADGDAGFDFGNRAIDYLDRFGAMATFVVLGPLERSSGVTQMGERGTHVRLIGPNRLNAHAGNQDSENHTCP